MNLIRAFVTAIMTYSVVPMPQVKWEEKNTRYAIAFFPFVGVIIGVILYAWNMLCEAVGISDMIFAAGAIAIPVLITGGIHIDGYMDTIDALASHTDREKMLEIIKDSRVGAFAVIYEVVYMIVAFAVFCSCMRAGIIAVCISFIISRCISGILATLFPNARKSGMLSSMMGEQEKKTKSSIAIWLVIILIICVGAIVILSGLIQATIMLTGAVLAVIYYVINVVKKLGGVTGDTSGYFLQICELYMLIGFYISTII